MRRRKAKKGKIMKKSNVVVVRSASVLAVSKTFYKKSCIFGTEEYYELNAAMAQNEGFKVAIKKSDKKTYHGLSFKVMEAYIKTQKDSEKQLVVFEAVKRIAKTKGSQYPLTKKWFLENYPEYKKNEATQSEIDAQIAAELDALELEDEGALELVG